MYSFIDSPDSYLLDTTDDNKINILLNIVPETDTSDVLRIKVKPRQHLSKFWFFITESTKQIEPILRAKVKIFLQRCDYIRQKLSWLTSFISNS